jgi:hypothetical protein
VWDHLPTARELLDHRLGQGWKPTPTLLQSGARILGYAGCAVTHARKISEPRQFDVDTAP